ncbi:MAG: RNA recognition motif domain-containing protein [Desulfohalobiaceae bacterium]
MKLYVGNLPYSHNDFALQDLFSPFGEVASAQVIIDHHSGRSRGFGFVEMTNSQEAQKAQETLHGSSLEGRDLIVNEARQDKKRSRD